MTKIMFVCLGNICRSPMAEFLMRDLVEKLGRSDEFEIASAATSTWELGNGVPDVYILMQLANLYGVTVNDLLGDNAQEKAKENKKRTTGLHVLIMLLSSGIVWLVATCGFVALQLLNPGFEWWLIFIYALTANSILLLVYAGVWKYRLLNFICVTGIVWGALIGIYLTFRIALTHMGGDISALWLIFLLGIPLQILEVLWVFFRSLFKRQKAKKKGV